MIKYSDSEVKKFHPLCEDALNKALVSFGKSIDYEVLHHQYTGSLEMDYVIRNKTTLKYFCVVEVKRTPNDVQSTRYQFQAQSYVQMNASQNERPYFIITNLEKLISFRYDTSKPRVYQQMLKPGLEHICDFKSDDNADIVDKLATAFERILGDFFSDNYAYSTTLEQFISYMDSTRIDDKKWKSSMAILMYEYIRGVFSAIRRPEIRYDVRKFHDDVEQICIEANRVDFDGIFKYDASSFLPRLSVASTLLNDIYSFGNVNISGDSVADALHNKLSENKHHDGEVATDSELALLTSTLAKLSAKNLTENSKICDPAAGSGNLICSAIPSFNVSASTLKANDVNKKLVELLSLRLGLSFPLSINKSDSPLVSSQNIVDLPEEYFDDVDVVLLNPPFVAGINCVDRKKPLYQRIRELKGSDPITLTGQMNLGAVFLETICHLVKPRTTIACIFPKAHLTARGDEAVILRKMLLGLFGLHTIFNYPAEDLFDAVTEETCIFVGRTKEKSEFIRVYSSDEKVSNIDLHLLETYNKPLSTLDFQNIIPGVEGRSFTWDELSNDADNGWRMVCSEMTVSIDFVSHHILSNPKLVLVDETTDNSKRGNVGGSGGSDLLFFDSIPKLFAKYTSVPLGAGLRNAGVDSFELTDGDSKFLDFNVISETIAHKIITDYNPLQKEASGQKRNSKSVAEWYKIAKRNGKVVFSPNSVLVPTKLRKTGRVHVTRVPMHISTNFAVFTYDTVDAANIVGSYMTTLLYQLECEVQSKDHAGLRKSEIKDIKTTHAPLISALSEKEIRRINSELPNVEFLDLNNPRIRTIDRIWAEILYGDDADNILAEAEQLLRFLANRRNPPS